MIIVDSTMSRYDQIKSMISGLSDEELQDLYDDFVFVDDFDSDNEDESMRICGMISRLDIENIDRLECFIDKEMENRDLFKKD